MCRILQKVSDFFFTILYFNLHFVIVLKQNTVKEPNSMISISLTFIQLGET